MDNLGQIQANLLNAQSPAGPGAFEGRSASRMNALKAGVNPKSPIMRGASHEAFAAGNIARFQPPAQDRHDLPHPQIGFVPPIHPARRKIGKWFTSPA